MAALGTQPHRPRRFRKALGYFGALILGVLLLLIVVVSFSEVPANFDCITEGDQRVALRINRYRWWVHLWATEGTDGDAQIQSPDLREFRYYSRVQISGDVVWMIDPTTEKRLGQSAYYFRLTRQLHLETASTTIKASCNDSN